MTTSALDALEFRFRDRVSNGFTTPSFSLTHEQQKRFPDPGDGGVNCFHLKLLLQTNYGVAVGSHDKVYDLAYRRARAAMADFLYRDIITDLYSIMELCGEGKREEAMDGIEVLIRRLRD